ncbi:hypothetical protein GN958_ATG04030, partial [Phytophthora infestans]
AALRAKKQARRDGSANASGRRSTAKAAKPVTAKLSNPSSSDGCPRNIHPHRLNGNFSRPPQLVKVPKVRHAIPPPSPSGTPLDLASRPRKSPLQADSSKATALSPIGSPGGNIWYDTRLD